MGRASVQDRFWQRKGYMPDEADVILRRFTWKHYANKSALIIAKWNVIAL